MGQAYGLSTYIVDIEDNAKLDTRKMPFRANLRRAVAAGGNATVQFTSRVGTLPWGSRRAKDFLDVHDLNLSSEFVSIDTVTISQQIFWSAVERKCLQNLLRCPFCGGMGCNVEVDDAAAIMFNHDKDE